MKCYILFQTRRKSPEVYKGLKVERFLVILSAKDNKFQFTNCGYFACITNRSHFQIDMF